MLPIWRQRLPLDVVAPGDVLDVVELWVPRAGVQVLEPEPLARLLAQQLDDDAIQVHADPVVARAALCLLYTSDAADDS